MTGKSKIGPWRIDGQGMKVVKKRAEEKGEKESLVENRINKGKERNGMDA